MTYRFGTDTLAGYEYYLNGALAKMRYPTGRELSYTIDDLSRVTSLQGLKDGATSSYVNSASYTAFGGFDTIQLNGNRSRERYVYNPQRLQLQELNVERCLQADAACTGAASQLRLAYDYGVANNGNPREQRIEAPGMAVKQSYLYDAWNRLKTFTESPLAGGAAAVTEEYCYDAHGNRALLSGPSVPAQTPQVSACTASEVTSLFPNNRVTGLEYDAGGHLWRDFGRELRFDIEGRLQQSIPAGAGALTTNYAYDGEGRRVWMQTGTSSPVTFVYSAMGDLVAEYGTAGVSSGTQFLHADALGSTRLVTEAGEARRRFDYRPFGEELTAGQTSYRTAGLLFGSGEPKVRFTGKERDQETGLDYFGARYLAAGLGRFTSPDGPLVDQRPEDPQSWNLYAYVRNNPLRFIDPTGRTLSFVNERDEEQFKRYELALAKDPKKYGSQIATVDQLRKSDINFQFHIGGKEKSATAEGSTGFDGTNVTINIRDVGGENFSMTSRIAHELEHGRQVDSGELTFLKDASGNYAPSPVIYDAMDEVRAFQAQLGLSSPMEISKSPTLSRLSSARNEGEAAAAIIQAYPHLKNRPLNSVYRLPSSVARPGDIVRTGGFGRVNSVIP